MNEKFQQILINNFEGLSNWLGNSTNWVQDQIPLYIEEYIRYTIIKDSVFLLLHSLVMFILLTVFGIFLYNYTKNYDHKKAQSSYEDITVGLGMVSAFMLLFYGVAQFHNVDELLKAYFAPRVFMTDEILSKLRDIK